MKLFSECIRSNVLQFVTEQEAVCCEFQTINYAQTGTFLFSNIPRVDSLCSADCQRRVMNLMQRLCVFVFEASVRNWTNFRCVWSGGAYCFYAVLHVLGRPLFQHITTHVLAKTAAQSDSARLFSWYITTQITQTHVCSSMFLGTLHWLAFVYHSFLILNLIMSVHS